MPALASDLRRILETTVGKARELAERGAREALAALDVGGNSHIPSMTAEQERLRRRLRAHGRQLGDQAGPSKGSQNIERLVREMAYEHWHRMLFARFLAENQLLIEPSSGVAVSLAEVEELAAEEGTDLWELAASYAQGMLPEIFRTDDPVLALRLPLEIRQQLQALVAGLDAEVFTASDSLGWTYQFWQTKRKKEVNDSGVKIGADELPPVTQLFTEDYMVDFLLDNTLGAWHAGKMFAANPELASTAQTEDDLRQAVALPGCSWSYLRFIKSGDGAWAPAAGSFEGWPRTAAELKCLDPCMGSGHFVVAMFERLVALRQAEGEQLEAEAVAAVIESNLFGLEIDPRCTQIAAFNLALAAWRRVGHCKLPAMNLACSGLAPNTREADWLAMACDNERLRNGMERLYRLFQKASVLGSLINPRAAEGDLLEAGFHELQPLLEQALAQENQDDTAYELAVTARGVAKAAEILAGQFTLVATNVPYLGRGKQDESLMNYCERVHPDAKADLATCFVERCLSFCTDTATTALVTPQNWLFLGGYKPLRQRALNDHKWDCLARLGARAFETIGGEIVNVSLVSISRLSPTKAHRFASVDVSEQRAPQEKNKALPKEVIAFLTQSNQLRNPDARISAKEHDSELPQLGDYAECYQGAVTGDLERFRVRHWEIRDTIKTWQPFRTTINTSTSFDGLNAAIKWQQGSGELHEYAAATRDQLHDMHESGNRAWNRPGAAINRMGELFASAYLGEIFDNNVAVVIPKNENDLLALLAFTSSPQFCDLVRSLDQTLKVTNRTLIKVPFDLAHWQKVAAENYLSGLPKPFSSDPTQWLFNGHPAGSDQPLHVAVARMLGYQWPRLTGSSFPDCPAVGPDGLESLADEDGIVCLAPVRGEASAVDRLRKLLAAAFGDEWSAAKERELLLATAVDNNAKNADPDLVCRPGDLRAKSLQLLQD
jgi:hypothetical protein